MPGDDAERPLVMKDVRHVRARRKTVAGVLRGPDAFPLVFGELVGDVPPPRAPAEPYPVARREAASASEPKDRSDEKLSDRGKGPSSAPTSAAGGALAALALPAWPASRACG